MAKTTRLQDRQARLRRRMDEAPTLALQLNAAFDWFRCSAEYLGKTGSRKENGHGPGYPTSAQIVAEVTGYLAQRAAEADAYCNGGDAR
jgi:hypothetical protein